MKHERIHCTCCNKHIGTAVKPDPCNRFKHPLLNVIVCEKCYLFYCSGDFEKDKDGSELYCRWCGQGGQVFCCSKCPYVFCKKCISRNLGRSTATIIENSDDWLCFGCNPCQISKQRAVAWAITKYAEEIIDREDQSLDSQLNVDYSLCCKSKRQLTKAITPAAKRQKTSSPLPRIIEKKNASITPAFEWKNNLADGEDEVVCTPDIMLCTPDIMPFEDSPPGSPIDIAPEVIMEDTPELDIPAAVKLKPVRTILPKLLPVIQNSSEMTTNVHGLLIKTQITGNKIILTSTPSPPLINNVKLVNNVIPNAVNVNNGASTSKEVPAVESPVTQRESSPVVVKASKRDEQWFGTAVIRSAEVTEYLSTNISELAGQYNAVSDDEKIGEIFRTLMSHIDIAVSKLKTLKHDITLSYHRVKPVQPAGSTGNKPRRASARKQNYHLLLDSSDSDEWKHTSESDEYYSSDSYSRRRNRKSKSTPKRKIERDPSEMIEEGLARIKNNSTLSHTASGFQETLRKEEEEEKRIIEAAKRKEQEEARRKEAEVRRREAEVRRKEAEARRKEAEAKKAEEIKRAQEKQAKVNSSQKIIDVIDLLDDDSNDPLDNPQPTEQVICATKGSGKAQESDNECLVPEIDSDISEILPDHLMDPDELKPKQKKLRKKKKDKKIKNVVQNLCMEVIDEDEMNRTESESSTSSYETDDESGSDKEVNEEQIESQEETKQDAEKEKEQVESTSKNEENSQEKTNLDEDKSVTKNEDTLKSKDETVDEESDKKSKPDEEINTNGNDKKSDISESEINPQSPLSPKVCDKRTVDIKTNGNDSSSAQDLDFEEFLSSSTIVNNTSKTAKVNFDAEFSKFVSSSVTESEPVPEDTTCKDVLNKELDFVSKICQQEDADGALSLPPGNTSTLDDIALELKDDNFDSKNGSEKNDKDGLESDLNVLRKLAENCITLNNELNDTKLPKS